MPPDTGPKLVGITIMRGNPEHVAHLAAGRHQLLFLAHAQFLLLGHGRSLLGVGL